MNPDLKAIVDEAYRVFGDYRLHRSLSVCRCNSCMSEKTEAALLRTPLREIPSNLLAEYTNSAHGWDDGPIAREMRYFLPRYLDLIARNDPPDTMGLDICLRRLGSAGWRTTWPEPEVRLLDSYFDALVAASVRQVDLVEWPVGWRLAFDFTDVLTLIVTAHGNLERALAAWDAASEPGAAIHMAALRERVLTSGGRTYLHSAYLEGDYDDAADAIGRFLLRPEVDRRIEAAFFEIVDARMQKLLSDAIVRP